MNLSLDTVRQAFESVCTAGFEQPDLLIMHPTTYALWQRFLRISARANELLRDEFVRGAWLDGWTARTKQKGSKRRQQREWSRWCWARANEEEDKRAA